MGFRSFTVGIFVRVALLVVVVFFSVYFYLVENLPVVVVVGSIFVVLITANLVNFAQITNRKITRFLASIQYSDFSSTFTKDSKLGVSFAEMNFSFNQVIEAFKKTRAEKEEQMLLLQIMIQHVNTGIISFNSQGRIGVINGVAKQLLKIPQFKDIHDLAKLSAPLLQKVLALQPGGSFSLRIHANLHLNVQSASFKLQGESWTLISFQNIIGELQKNELQAWQNLTKVLRHEIMNSMTPIASLANSLGIILKEDSQVKKENFVLERESFEDLSEGLTTIAKSSLGLVDFVNAYRDYTNIPSPNLEKISVGALFEKMDTLLKTTLAERGFLLRWEVQPPDLEVLADEELIRMVLINLIKNAQDALAQTDHRDIVLKAGFDAAHVPFIQVIDRGEGIVPEAMEHIFVPFYTTKKTGSGIGLALSRQIMGLHNGTLEVSSTPGKQTVFQLTFG